jgi:repressor LexA
MEPLTKKQEEVLTSIKKYIAKNGYSPSVREVCEMMNLSSTATVFVHMRHLMNKGYLKQTDNKFRTLEVLVPNEYLETKEDVVSVPLVGKVSCGNPIEAIEFPDEYISLPAYMIPKKEEIFTLKTEGMSMKNVGIFDGDIVIVKRTSSAKNGDFVVALDENGFTTLKTFYKEDGHYRLQPENETMSPIILDKVDILGIAIGLYRQL